MPRQAAHCALLQGRGEASVAVRGYAVQQRELTHGLLQIQELYSYYLQHAEMPAKRAELAQLRELLDLEQQDTASLEAAVFGSGDGWMI